jgi:hypothetical protein
VNGWCAVALDTIATALVDCVRRLPSLDALDAFGAGLRVPGATFVTLERDGRLLGCVGSLEARRPLGIDIAGNALAAAFDDPRVPPVTVADFAEMHVKVSRLDPSELVPARSHDELRAVVRPGVDGITVSAGPRRATLLPSVWAHVRDAGEFLDVLWAKAGLTPRTWPDGIAVARYTTVEAHDPGPRRPL